MEPKEKIHVPLNNTVFAAVKSENIESIKNALKTHPNGVNYHYEYCIGFTSLHWAARINNEDICKLLLNHNQTNVNELDYKKYTPLRVAAEDDCIESAKLLIQYGASCKGWQTWKLHFGHYIVSQRIHAIKQVMVNWRSFLPEWSPKMHKRYPQDFKDMAFACLCVFNRFKLYKDIRFLLINFVAKNWRKIKDFKRKMGRQ